VKEWEKELNRYRLDAGHRRKRKICQKYILRTFQKRTINIFLGFFITMSARSNDKAMSIVQDYSDGRAFFGYKAGV
jgi:hypothetical protein